MTKINSRDTSLDQSEIGQYILAKINELPTLNPRDKDKLGNMFGKYQQAIRAAIIIDPQVTIKSPWEVCDAFTPLPTLQLQKAVNMHSPRLVITPKNSFASKVASMNGFKPYRDAQNKEGSQHKLVLLPGVLTRDTQAISNPKFTHIDVIEGLPTLPDPDYIPTHPGPKTPDDTAFHRREDFRDYAESQGLRIIGIHRYAALQVIGQVDYLEHSHDITRIIDYYHQNLRLHCTAFSDEDINYESFTSGYMPVLAGYFDAKNCGAAFTIASPEHVVLPRTVLPLLKY
jgi:hypothetical protein